MAAATVIEDIVAAAAVWFQVGLTSRRISLA